VVRESTLRWPVDDAVGQVNAALDKLKEQGEKKLFIAGHSKGAFSRFTMQANIQSMGSSPLRPGETLEGRNSGISSEIRLKKPKN